MANYIGKVDMSKGGENFLELLYLGTSAYLWCMNEAKVSYANVELGYKYLKLKERPCEDRPREKMIRYGRQVLSNAELLGLVLGSGIENMSSVDLAQNILQSYNHELLNLSNCSVEELQKFKGIGPAKAVLILSVLELSRRLRKGKAKERPRVKTARQAYQVIQEYFVGKVTEECWLLLLNSDHRLLKCVQVSRGGFSRTEVDPAVVMKEVLLHNSTRFIIAHNHPSGNPNPSKADIGFTERIEAAAKHINVKLLDHIIVTEKGYFSFGNEGLLL